MNPEVRCNHQQETTCAHWNVPLLSSRSHKEEVATEYFISTCLPYERGSNKIMLIESKDGIIPSG